MLGITRPYHFQIGLNRVVAGFGLPQRSSRVEKIGIHCTHLIREERMVKCSRRLHRELKAASQWQIPPVQRQRIQMVLLRESGMSQPAIVEAMGVSLSTVNQARLVCGFVSESHKNRLRSAGIDVRLGSCACSVNDVVANFDGLLVA
jgi:Homeodomain-like domain